MRDGMSTAEELAAGLDPGPDPDHGDGDVEVCQARPRQGRDHEGRDHEGRDVEGRDVEGADAVLRPAAGADAAGLTLDKVERGASSAWTASCTASARWPASAA